LALVALSVVEQRYRAILQAAAGVPVTEVAERFGVSRQSVHAWIRRYEQGGLGALMDRSRLPCRRQRRALICLVWPTDHDRSHLVPNWSPKCSKNRRDGRI